MGEKNTSTREEQNEFLYAFAEKKLRRQNSWYMKALGWTAPKLALIGAGGGIWYVIANFAKIVNLISGGSPADDGYF